MWRGIISGPVVDLWENQSAMYFLTYFDYFFGGSIQTWGVERHQRGVKPPDKSSTDRGKLLTVAEHEQN